jgi:hypothetical protein
MKCLDCVSVCPKDALYVGFAMPKPFATSQQRLSARADFTWPEEIAMAVIAVVATQWTFRGAWFGEGIPFLMAVGLGVITAVFAMAAWRLVRRKDVAFQHTALKQSGKFTRAGRWAFAGLLAWLLFTAHTFVGQRLRAHAMDVARQPVITKMYEQSKFDRHQADEALADVERAAKWVAVVDPQLGEVHALLLGSIGRHSDAETKLVALRERFGRLHFPESGMALATYFLRDPARRDEGLRLLERVVAENPQNNVARYLLQRANESGR